MRIIRTNGKREQKKLDIKKRIYEVGMALFAEKGYNNTTLVEIAAVAGVSTRTLYKYYPAKEDILFKFSKDHVKALEKFAKSLPQKMDIKDKVVTVMLKDFATISQSEYFKVHHKEKWSSMLANTYELENMIYLEGIYQQLLEDEQKKHNILNAPDCHDAAIILVGIYRQVTDRLLLKEGQFEYPVFKKSYEACLDALWSGIENLFPSNT